MSRLTLADSLHNLPYSLDEAIGPWISSCGIGILRAQLWDVEPHGDSCDGNYQSARAATYFCQDRSLTYGGVNIYLTKTIIAKATKHCSERLQLRQVPERPQKASASPRP